MYADARAAALAPKRFSSGNAARSPARMAKPALSMSIAVVPWPPLSFWRRNRRRALRFAIEVGHADEKDVSATEAAIAVEPANFMNAGVADEHFERRQNALDRGGAANRTTGRNHFHGHPQAQAAACSSRRIALTRRCASSLGMRESAGMLGSTDSS